MTDEMRNMAGTSTSTSSFLPTPYVGANAASPYAKDVETPPYGNGFGQSHEAEEELEGVRASLMAQSTSLSRRNSRAEAPPPGFGAPTFK
jgi:hypothetical protein